MPCKRPRNPGKTARLARRVASSTQRSLARQLASWVRSKKGTPGYYAWKRRRKNRR